jgi:hypothetical protein
MAAIILERLLDTQLVKIYRIGETGKFVSVTTQVGLSSLCWNISLRFHTFENTISIESYVENEYQEHSWG